MTGDRTRFAAAVATATLAAFLVVAFVVAHPRWSTAHYRDVLDVVTSLATVAAAGLAAATLIALRKDRRAQFELSQLVALSEGLSGTLVDQQYSSFRIPDQQRVLTLRPGTLPIAETVQHGGPALEAAWVRWQAEYDALHLEAQMHFGWWMALRIQEEIRAAILARV